MRYLLDFCYFLAALVVAPLLAYKSARTGKYRRDWDQRRGWMPVLEPKSPRIWIHAVSMGEINSIRGLVDAWRARRPTADFVVSTTTDTGMDRARQLFTDLTVVRYPLDFSRWVERALDRLRPTMVVLVELEVWPQFISLCAARRIPIAVVNGRVTESKSLRGFRPVLPLIQRIFAKLAWVGAQDEVYAERFRLLGVPAQRVTVTGSMKWDTAQIADAIPGSDTLAAALGIDSHLPLWVCGSTGPGEEEVILKAYGELRRAHPSLQLVIVPRKPERFDEVAALIQRAGFTCVRRSAAPDGSRSAPAINRVFLGDTMGELRKFYSLATVVFVGRTLVDMGGSDMIEVAALAKPIIVGPHVDNFADTVHQLEHGQAIRIVPANLKSPNVSGALSAAVGQLLCDPRGAAAMAGRAREIAVKNRGATQRTLDHLEEVLAAGLRDQRLHPAGT